MTTTGIVLTESLHPGDFMVSEAPGRLSRQAVLIAAAVTTGLILGAATKGMGTFAAAAGVAGGSNTGNGTMGTPSAGVGAQVGSYTVEYIAPTLFNVIDPSGKLIGEGANSAAFAGQIGFTMTAGTTPFAAGDKFTVAVTETDPADAGEYLPLNLSATDGTENAAGISWDNYTPPSGGTMSGTAIVRNAEVKGVNLTYPSGANSTQIAAINAQLAALGIIVR